ncbi:hypothetical protein J7J00_23095 [Bacillus sp. ISL-4]|uniref:hypothetical protein n=1 Tax=Bacillus sp. ISL-4 TaxID=2819125 RepID=UPI001BEA2D01|nr:hypothetical protein [Bacillus sp. ISL-4]MBT2668330.1 hypothetical protein [Bacillus sp. ISL-4]MBT2671881.1 hypothetical protein [Streptomyces sp. ISL-14]
MIKGNSYILVFTMLVLLTIVLVSTTPIIIKTLLALITIAFLFPVIRKLLFKVKFRKIKVAFYSSLTFTIGLFLVSIFEEPSFNFDGDFSLIIIVLFYSLIGNFVYGLPVSLIAEIISMKYFNIRFWLSGLIHIGFGLATYFIDPGGFFIFAVICSIIFFALDEITKLYSAFYWTNLRR